MVVEDAGDFELVAKSRMLKIAVADGSSVLERETASDSAQSWAWGFVLRRFLPLECVKLSCLPAIEAFFPLSLQSCELDQSVSATPLDQVFATKVELVRMKTFADEFLGFCWVGASDCD